MKLHSPEFERRLKGGVREAVRRSAELRKEARRVRKPRHFSAHVPARIGLSAVLALLVWVMARKTGDPTAGLALLSLWMLVWLCGRVEGLQTSLYAHPDLSALALLPVPTPILFRWQLQKFLQTSVLSLVDLLAGLGAYAAFQGFSTGQWLLVPVVALCAWLVFLALVFLFAAHWPHLPYGMIWGLGWGLGAVCLIGRELVGKYVIALVSSMAPVLNLLPTGWSLSLASAVAGRDSWPNLLWLLPIAGVISTMKSSLVRLHGRCEFTEDIAEVPPDLVPGEEEAAVPTAAESAMPPRHLGTTAIEEIVLSRCCFAGSKWHEAGTLERLLWRWLSPREHALAEFVFPHGIEITAAWRRIFRNLLVATAAAVALGWWSPRLRLWILGLGFFVTVCQTLAQLFGTGQAFAPVQCSGVHIPLYAAYTIGFRELARLLFKCSFARSVFLIPFAVTCGGLAAWLFRWPWLDGVTLGLKAGVLLLAVPFITVTFGFSSGTNDSGRFAIRTFVLLGSVVSLGLIFLGLATVALLVPDAIVAWSSCALAILGAYAFFRAYGWFYHANWFDLMKVVR